MLPIIKDLLLALKTAVTSGFKFLFSKIIKQKNAGVTFRPGASAPKQDALEQDDPEIEYWKNLLERGIAAKTAAQEQVQEKQSRISMLIQKFENKKIYRQARKISLGKAELILLANTVLTKNIFAKEPNANITGTCVYEEVLNTQAQAGQATQRVHSSGSPNICIQTTNS